MAKMAPPTLTNMPQEVYDMICSRLSSRSIKALRRLNREFHTKTEDNFIQRHFTEIEIDLSIKKLEYLLSVSHNKKYADRVEQLVIEPRVEVPESEYDKTPAPFAWGQHEKWDYLRLRYPQNMFLKQEKLLTTALKTFRKLRSVEVARYDDPRRFQRNIIFPRYSIRRIENSIRNRHSETTPLSHAFSLVETALRTSHSPIRKLSAGAAPWSSAHRSSIDQVALPSKSNPALARLTDLHLVLELCAGSTGEDHKTRLADFLHQTRNLTTLRLEFWGFNTEWLSETFEMVELSRLEAVHLEACRNVDVQQLKGFLQRHAETLRHITLANVLFSPDSDPLDTFPSIFTSSNLNLHSLRLQRICVSGAGLVLFDKTGVETMCEGCKEDLLKVWAFEKGGEVCGHASCVGEGELETGRVMMGMGGVKEGEEVMGVLPWNVLRELCWETEQGGEEAGEEDGDGQGEGVGRFDVGDEDDDDDSF